MSVMNKTSMRKCWLWTCVTLSGHPEIRLERLLTVCGRQVSFQAAATEEDDGEWINRKAQSDWFVPGTRYVRFISGLSQNAVYNPQDKNAM